MRTILIAHPDQAFADNVALEFRKRGYRVITCPGHWPPAERCIRCDVGYCPLTESADVMVYDPFLSAVSSEGRCCNLARESARAHPEVPTLLAWTPENVPDAGTLLSFAQDMPSMHVAARSGAALLAQVRELLDRVRPLA